MIRALLILLICSPGAFAQYDNVGSGRALRFDGVDDYVDLGNIYDDLKFPMTISAWVYKNSSPQYILPIFVSQDNNPLYNGFWFCLSTTNLFFEYGDGRGEQSGAYRKGKSAFIPNINNRWLYVTAVISSSSDVQLFVNGYNVGGSIEGTSSQPMASNYPADVAKIGYFYTNSVVHRFDGMLDELRIWNRALTESEVRQTMCRRLDANEPGLIGYWNFDEISGSQLTDLSVNQFHGALKGTPQRVFSGAPVGDESTFLYSASWVGKSLVKEALKVENISGNPFGLHIYSVNDVPSQVTGLNASDVQLPYYGVFLADHNQGNTFDVSFSDNVCSVFQRADNSIAQWQLSQDFTAIVTRKELIRGSALANLELEIGEDVVLCDNESFSVKPSGVQNAEKFLWSTGETTRDITVRSSGVYWLEASKECVVDRDSIEVIFATTPPSFSLGNDEEVCNFEPRVLTVDVDPQKVDLAWNDGSDGTSYQVTGTGTYWLKMENECGVAIDSITFSKPQFTDLKTYNFISPDTGDEFNQFFALDERLMGAMLLVFNRWGKQVFSSTNYQNDWDGGGLAPGVYLYTVVHECAEPVKGVLTLMR
jgi:hypothetical protein